MEACVNLILCCSYINSFLFEKTERMTIDEVVHTLSLEFYAGQFQPFSAFAARVFQRELLLCGRLFQKKSRISLKVNSVTINQ